MGIHCRKFFLPKYSGWKINPEFDMTNVDPEKKESIISDSERLFQIIKNRNKMLMVGSTQESLETFVQAIELGVKGSFVWVSYHGALPDLTKLPLWLQEPVYYRGPFQMNVELLVCSDDAIILNNEYKKFLWDSCEITDCTDIHVSKTFSPSVRRNRVLPESELENEANKLFCKDDGWLICGPSMNENEMNAIYHWRSVLEVLHVLYKYHLYYYYSILVPVRAIVIWSTLYAGICLIPGFIAVAFQYSWGIVLWGLTMFYSFQRYFFTLFWLAYNPRGETTISKRGILYREVSALLFSSTYCSLTQIPFTINTYQYQLSPATSSIFCLLCVGCNLILNTIHNGYFSYLKTKWSLGICALPTCLFFLFPPIIIISILLEEISPTLSGLYVSFSFILLEYGSVTLWKYLFDNLVLSSSESNLKDASTPIKINQCIVGDQKTPMVTVIIATRIWCETARLCTLCSIIILSSWNDGFTGQENHMMYISSGIFSLILSTLARTGYGSNMILFLLKNISSQYHEYWEKYSVPSIWTWVHRDCSFYFGYPRFILIGAIFFARGYTLKTGFQFYTYPDHSLCWTPAVFYSCILNFVLELIEDVLVYKSSKKTRINMMKKGTQRLIVTTKNNPKNSYHRVTILQNKSMQYESQYDCTRQTYSLLLIAPGMLSNFLLTLILFVIFIGKDSFLGIGKVSPPNEYLLQNLSQLIVWQVG